MIIEFNKYIEQAFIAYKDGNCIASDNAMCMRLGIPRSTYANWIKGRSRTIKRELWEKLEPQLRPYINVTKISEPIADGVAEQVLDYCATLQNEPDEVIIAKLAQEVMALRRAVSEFKKMEKITLPAKFHTLPAPKQKELLDVFKQMVNLIDYQ